jgi:cell fate (sporulation/competence/biofilm development) regulator YlbF (YheA/YmcA/DUF963 family)
MPTLEVDEQEYKTLRQARELLEKMNGNPKSRRDYQRALKVVVPDMVTDEERVAEAPEVKRLSSLEAKFDKFLEAQEKREQDNEVRSAFDRLRTAGYTDEGVGAIQKLMIERKIADPEAAAALFDKTNKAKDIIPSGFAPTSWGFGAPPADDDTKLLFENEDAWAEKEARKAFLEP